MKTIQHKLAGTSWSLESYQSENKEGDVIYPLGEDAKGVIMFTPDNRLSVHIMAVDRTKEPNEEKIKKYNTEAEKQMARLGYHAYSGPISINEEEEVLTTQVELSVLPTYVGSKQKRAVTIKDNQLHLSNISHPERKLVWNKL